MASFKLASWNVEWMHNWFEPEQAVYRTHIEGKPSQGLVADAAQRVADVIKEIDADILCIQEGPKLQTQIQNFVATHLAGAYTVLPTPSKRDQNVWILYKPATFQSAATLENDTLVQDDLYTSWEVFYWGDSPSLLFSGQVDSHYFYRKPCVAEFVFGGSTFRVINCHTKSKFIQGGQSLWKSTKESDKVKFIKGSLKDRIKITSEVRALRNHLDHLLAGNPLGNVIVVGDLNDGPGRDLFERFYFYHNLVDVLLGTLMEPDLLLYHVLSYVPETDRYTAVFDDFVEGIDDNKIQLDHILCSPALARKANGLLYQDVTAKVERQAWMNHSAIPEDKDDPSFRRADRPSDHRPLSVQIKT